MYTDMQICKILSRIDPQNHSIQCEHLFANNFGAHKRADDALCTVSVCALVDKCTITRLVLHRKSNAIARAFIEYNKHMARENRVSSRRPVNGVSSHASHIRVLARTI